MSSAPIDSQSKKVHFLSQVRLGDLLTIGSILLASVAWWAKTDARLQRIDEIIVEIKAEARQQRADMKEVQLELRGDIRETRNEVASVSRKIDRDRRGARE